MEEGVPLGVRKGAWIQEEDLLLRKCIEKHGEGKWHQVPLRAGLNRCRKSCRLRWLNYLRPDIKRGSFVVDEVDLIIRLHKLLGNRWSLIAGRLPGRTANDVKNYWNTHLQKKVISQQREEEKAKSQKAMEMTKIIRPQPRTFSKNNLPWLTTKTTIMDHIQTADNLTTKPSPTDHNYIQTRDNLIYKPSLTSAPEDNGSSWLDNMIVDMELDIENGLINDGDLWDVNMTPAGMGAVAGDSFNQEKNQSDWSDILVNNVNLWDLLGDEQAVI